MSSNKIFDDYDVLCDECEHYWLNTCDAPPVGTVRLCNSFKATRRVNYHHRIKVLEKRFKWLKKASLLQAILSLLIVIKLVWFI